MKIVLIILALCHYTYVRSCRPKGGSPIWLNTTYWEPIAWEKSMWKIWLDAYNKKMEEDYKDQDTDYINDGRPPEFQGYGHGTGGVPPPPWAIFPGDYGKPDQCFQEPDQGNCKNKLIRWGYNPYTQQCVKFIYTGCGGNDNIFFSKPRCEITCAITAATNCQLYDDYGREIKNKKG